jgi:hypothetical protein
MAATDPFNRTISQFIDEVVTASVELAGIRAETRRSRVGGRHKHHQDRAGRAAFRALTEDTERAMQEIAAAAELLPSIKAKHGCDVLQTCA